MVMGRVRVTATVMLMLMLRVTVTVIYCEYLRVWVTSIVII
jgi:hypothetical protein